MFRDLIDLHRAVEGSAVDTREHWRSSTKVRRWHRDEPPDACSSLTCAGVGGAASRTFHQINALLTALRNSREDSGNTSKSIVFSQFTSFLDLLEVALKKADFQVTSRAQRPCRLGRCAS